MPHDCRNFNNNFKHQVRGVTWQFSVFACFVSSVCLFLGWLRGVFGGLRALTLFHLMLSPTRPTYGATNVEKRHQSKKKKQQLPISRGMTANSQLSLCCKRKASALSMVVSQWELNSKNKNCLWRAFLRRRCNTGTLRKSFYTLEVVADALSDY